MFPQGQVCSLDFTCVTPNEYTPTQPPNANCLRMADCPLPYECIYLPEAPLPGFCGDPSSYPYADDCRSNADCLTGQICSPGYACRKAAVCDPPCQQGQKCFSSGQISWCVASSDAGDCSYDSDCPKGQECVMDLNCETGECKYDWHCQ